jgi:hypothetical protein
MLKKCHRRTDRGGENASWGGQAATFSSPYRPAVCVQERIASVCHRFLPCTLLYALFDGCIGRARKGPWNTLTGSHKERSCVPFWNLGTRQREHGGADLWPRWSERYGGCTGMASGRVGGRIAPVTRLGQRHNRSAGREQRPLSGDRHRRCARSHPGRSATPWHDPQGALAATASWVMSKTSVLCSLSSALSKSRICTCTVTSKAEVGPSAMIRSGSGAKAAAINKR